MDSLQNEKYYGTLRVQATSGSKSVPVIGATVVIRLMKADGKSELFRVLTTGDGGLTPKIRIETPPPAESLSPGIEKPYTEIATEVIARGYYTVVNTGVPIYPGITSIQPVRMIPIPTREDGTPFPPETIVIQEGNKTQTL